MHKWNMNKFTVADDDDWSSYLFKGVLVVVFVFTFLGAAILPIVDIVFGAVYLHDCPYKAYLPVYLIVLGLVWLLWMVSFLLNRYLDMDEWCACCNPNVLNGLILAIFLLLLGIQISGAVAVTSFDKGDYNATEGPTDIPGAPNYCEPRLHQVAFDVTWIMLILDFTFPMSYCFIFSLRAKESTIDRRRLTSSLTSSLVRSL